MTTTLDAQGPVDCEVMRDALALYEAPFRYQYGYIFDARNKMVADDDARDVALRVRGWGRISYLPNPEKLQDAVGELIALALTEYWQNQAKQARYEEVRNCPHDWDMDREYCKKCGTDAFTT